MALQHIRSSTLDKRPQPASLSDGQLAINTNLNAPGVFFKDSNGALVKVGPTFVGTTAPNSTPGSGGATGNTLGEQWLDTSGGTYVLKIWDGTAWRSEAGEFVNVTGDTMTGALVMDNQQQVRFRETTANGTNYIALQAPASVASDKTITLPDVTGTVVTTGDTGSVTSTMILDGTILNADVNTSAAIAGTKISPDFGSQNVTTTGTVTGASLNPTSSTVPTNGVYLPAANSVGISTNGTGRLFVNSSGLVGVGTASPVGALDVVSPSDSLGINLRGRSADSIGTFSFYSNDGATNNAQIQMRPSDNELRYLVGGARAQTFYTNGLERVRIDSSGRVGIGTTPDRAALDIVGGNAGDLNNPAVFIQNSKFLTLRQTSGNWGMGLYVDGSNNSYTLGLNNLIFGTGSSATERFRCDSSGRLLVGTSTARSNFFNSATAPQFQIEGSTLGGATASVTRSSADAFGPIIALGKSRNASVGGNTVVNSGDECGTLDFQGNDGTEFVTLANITAAVDGTPGANDMPGRLVFSTTADGASSPTSRLVIKEGGDIVIPSASATKGLWIGTGDAAGNSASANYRIGQNSTGVGSGTLYIGNAAIQVSSDARLKENIQDTTLSAVEELQKVRVVDFTWNDPSDTSYNNRNARGTWTGVIAQELVEIFPFAVNAPRKENDLSIDHDSDSTWTVEQQQLVPVLIKAIQEQQAVIAHLQSRVVVLETK